MSGAAAAPAFAFPGKTARGAAADSLAMLQSRSVRPRLVRSFEALQQSSESLASGAEVWGGAAGGSSSSSSSSSSGGGSGNAVRRPRMAEGLDEADHILAHKGLDLLEKDREILQLSDRLASTADEVRTETFRPTEIDELLQNFHERTTWKKLVYSSWDRAETDVQTMHQRWAAEDWANARQQFMESLGHRTQKWNPEAASKTDPAASWGVSAGVAANSAGSDKKYLGQKMSTMALRHARVIRQAAESRGRGPTSLARDLTAVISDAISARWAAQQDSLEDDMNLQELMAYKDVMKMLSEVVGETMERTSCPAGGSFSSICFHEHDVGTATARQVRSQLTLGAKIHLEKQKYEDWSAEIDEAVTQGRLKRVTEAGPAESRQQRIRSYVGFSFHLGNFRIPADAAFSPKHATISDKMAVHVPVWALLYHCLRVGELEGAMKEIESCRQAGFLIDDATLVCLRTMSALTQQQQQPNAPSLTPLQRQDLYQAMYTCQRLFEEEYDKPAADPCAPHSRDNYKALVLNLLSIGANQEATSELQDAVLGSNFQIEDFLWASLWFVTWANVARLDDSIVQQGGAMNSVLVNLRSKRCVLRALSFSWMFLL